MVLRERDTASYTAYCGARLQYGWVRLPAKSYLRRVLHYPFYLLFLFFFKSIFTKALKRYNEYAYSKGAVKSWNSLHDNDTPFPKQSE